jgi:hypothetical protein
MRVRAEDLLGLNLALGFDLVGYCSLFDLSRCKTCRPKKQAQHLCGKQEQGGMEDENLFIQKECPFMPHDENCSTKPKFKTDDLIVEGNQKMSGLGD